MVKYNHITLFIRFFFTFWYDVEVKNILSHTRGVYNPYDNP